MILLAQGQLVEKAISQVPGLSRAVPWELQAGALEAEAEEPSWAKEYRHRGLLKGLKPDWMGHVRTLVASASATLTAQWGLKPDHSGLRRDWDIRQGRWRGGQEETLRAPIEAQGCKAFMRRDSHREEREGDNGGQMRGYRAGHQRPGAEADKTDTGMKPGLGAIENERTRRCW
ncbi:hypothetical protein Cadr_000018747 [Camelus dromedarius]|uniref:Uncharacterized protein n=1 Tax=Camelus dromedarius TaxID=9838 RepID=A0A5N4D623_CAMDR|nr:hypothetical protein Cadr_000018747 [Camelus dromedarius]